MDVLHCRSLKWYNDSWLTVVQTLPLCTSKPCSAQNISWGFTAKDWLCCVTQRFGRDGRGFQVGLTIFQCFFLMNDGEPDVHHYVFLSVGSCRIRDCCCTSALALMLSLLSLCVFLCRVVRGQWYLWIWMPTTGTGKPCALSYPESHVHMWVLLSVHLLKSVYKWQPAHSHWITHGSLVSGSTLLSMRL